MLSHADVSQSVSAVISYESVLFHFLISWGQMCVCASQTFFFSKLSVSICPIHGKKSESYFPIPNMRSWKKPSTRTRIFLGTKGGKWRRLWTFLKTASTWMLILIYFKGAKIKLSKLHWSLKHNYGFGNDCSNWLYPNSNFNLMLPAKNIW